MPLRRHWKHAVPSNCNCRKVISPLFAHDLFSIKGIKEEMLSTIHLIGFVESSIEHEVKGHEHSEVKLDSST